MSKVPAAPPAPTGPLVKDLPKMAGSIQEGLSSFDRQKNLKHVETEEHVVMPSKEDVQTEKAVLAHDQLVAGVSTFRKESLSHCHTDEKVPLPTAQDVAQEKQHMQLIDGVAHFDKTELKHTVSEEKAVLPTKEDVTQERVELAHADISPHALRDRRGSLTHCDTRESNPLPTASAIIEEKKEAEFRKSIESFDPKELKQGPKPVEPKLPTKEELEAERKAAEAKK